MLDNGWVEESSDVKIQGDPFSMALFCLAIMPLLREAVELTEKPANDSKVCGIVKAYADDWHPAGSAQKVRKVFQYLYARAPDYGLETQPGKCSWFSLNPYANPDLTFEPGDICPGSPAISLPRTKDAMYEQLDEEEQLRLVEGSINHIPLAEFDAYYSFQAESYARSGIGRGSTRVLGSIIGDPQAVLLQLLEKVREFAVELQRLHILDGVTQEQVPVLRESYNARFDHLARSITPEVLAPAAFWYDHFVNLTIANIIKEAVTYKLSANDLPPSYESYDTYLQMLRRKPGDGGIGMMPLHTKLHSCFAGATGRSMSALAKANPEWLPHNWVDISRFATAESSFVKLREGLQQLDLSSLPETVAQPMRVRQKGLTGNFYPKKDEETENANEESVEQDDDTDEDQGGDQEAEVENATLVAIAGNNIKIQSQLTTVERFLINVEITKCFYKDESPEAQVKQAMNLSAATSTATLPIMVRPTHVSFMTESDVFVDLLRMQAGLALTDADRAVDECNKCNKEVDRLGYHAAFCPSTRSNIHDAVVNELRDCLRNAGACVYCLSPSTS